MSPDRSIYIITKVVLIHLASFLEKAQTTKMRHGVTSWFVKQLILTKRYIYLYMGYQPSYTAVCIPGATDRGTLR